LSITVYPSFEVKFTFRPKLLAAPLTLGFVGNITSYKSGLRWGSNTYILPKMTGWCKAAAHGTATISGTYAVIGYSPVNILKGISW
jgi:hypothetical protein